MKRIAVINDMSGFGRCSLTAAIPVISAMGMECCPLPTAVLSNQTGYGRFFCDDFTDKMVNFAEHWKGICPQFDGIFTGFVVNEKQVDFIADFIDAFSGADTVTLVDPVMGDDGKLYASYNTEMCEKLKGLVKKASVITPNLTELCILAGGNYGEICALPAPELFGKIEQISRSLTGDKLKTVVTTGIPVTQSGENYIATAVLWQGGFNTVTTKKIGGSFSGTGDLFASVTISSLLSGLNPLSAVIKATDFISKGIEETVTHSHNRNDGIDFQKFLKTL